MNSGGSFDGGWESKTLYEKISSRSHINQHLIREWCLHDKLVLFENSVLTVSARRAFRPANGRKVMSLAIYIRNKGGSPLVDFASRLCTLTSA